MPSAAIKGLIAYVLLIAGSIASSCTRPFPADPENSWESAHKHSLRVGIVDNLPFAHSQGGIPQGREVILVQGFAKAHGLKLTFINGSESSLIRELEAFRIDLLLGGFSKKTIWKAKAGLSRPYDSQHVMLVPMGENELLYQLENYLHHHEKGQ